MRALPLPINTQPFKKKVSIYGVKREGIRKQMKQNKTKKKKTKKERKKPKV